MTSCCFWPTVTSNMSFVSCKVICSPQGKSLRSFSSLPSANLLPAMVQQPSALVLMLHSLRTRRRYSFLPPEVLSAESKGYEAMAALSFADLNSPDNIMTMSEAWEAAVSWKDIGGHLQHSVLQQTLGEEKTQCGRIGGGKKQLGVSMKVCQDISYPILEFKTNPRLNPEEHSAIAWDDYIGC